MTSSRPLICAVAVAALILGLASPGASGKGGQQVLVKARIAEVNYDHQFDFSGLVETKKACRDDRRANLWYSPTMTGPQQKLGSDETSKSGAFDIHLDTQPQAGYYSVQVIKELEHKGDLKIICKPTVSARVFF